MTSLLYLIQSVLWIALGLIIGFWMGRTTMAADAIADAAQDEGVAVPETEKPARRWRFTGTHAIGAVVLVLGVFTAVQSSVQASATNELAECQQRYSNAVADALDARSASSQEAQAALDDLLSTVAAITPTPDGRDQFRVALAEYLDKRATAKRAQKEHPFPPAPRVCATEQEADK